MIESCKVQVQGTWHRNWLTPQTKEDKDPKLVGKEHQLATMAQMIVHYEQLQSCGDICPYVFRKKSFFFLNLDMVYIVAVMQICHFCVQIAYLEICLYTFYCSTGIHKISTDILKISYVKFLNICSTVSHAIYNILDMCVTKMGFLHHGYFLVYFLAYILYLSYVICERNDICEGMKGSLK